MSAGSTYDQKLFSSRSQALPGNAFLEALPLVNKSIFLVVMLTVDLAYIAISTYDQKLFQLIV
jgi:hypothetical protein